MMDDFKPKKPIDKARISRTPVTSVNSNLDDEISEAFVPPEAVAAAEQAEEPDDIIIINNDEPSEATTASATTMDTRPPSKEFTPPTGGGVKQQWHWWPPKVWVKKQWLLVGGVVLVVITLIAVLLFVVFHKKPVSKQAARKTTIVVPPKPTTVASRLTGLPVSLEQSKLPVTGVMIENSTDARPQSGLDQAGVVFEAVAEGGITRFLSLFEDQQPNYLGPVRSSRPYYLRWLLPFDASYAHVGGSPDALADIKKLGVKDLDQFYNSGPYQRIESRDAPHNVYTSLASLLTLEKEKNFNTSTFNGFDRKTQAVSQAPTAKSIDFTISGPAFSVHYDYDLATNSYKRNEGGAPHIVVDQTGKQTQLQPKVVIALIIPQSSGSVDAQGANYTQYDTIGTGQMYVFQDGEAIPGTWAKADDKSQFVFTDNAGKVIALNPGQTWISVVGLGGDVSYK